MPLRRLLHLFSIEYFHLKLRRAVLCVSQSVSQSVSLSVSWLVGGGSEVNRQGKEKRLNCEESVSGDCECSSSSSSNDGEKS